MKIRLPIFFVAGAMFAQQSPPKPPDLCEIEGHATNAATGAPVKNAELVLLRIEPDPQITYSATKPIEFVSIGHRPPPAPE